ncbi:MAG TPA: hypothetical protein VE974_28485 [Thermoanaerobaculia bacterium]|nr:hypothetical protein [Thermoanaerobaculia bacterium]
MTIDAALFVEEAVPVDDRTTGPLDVQSIAGFAPDHARSFLLVYDRNGRRATHQQFDGRGAVVHQWDYDAGGLLLRELAYEAASGAVRSTLDVLYDGDLWTEKRMHYAPHVLSYRIVAERDGEGRLARAVHLDPAGAPMRSDRYVFEGRVLNRVDMGPMGQRLYDYDARGNLGRKSIEMPGASAHGEVYEFKYDERGLLTAMHHLHGRSTTFRHEFFNR